MVCGRLASRHLCLPAVALCAVLSVAVSSAHADEPSPIAVGDEVPSFYVRAVTGPLAGKSVCYICRNGDRPVVAVMLRELTPESTALLKELDRTVNQHRAEGLRCFAVLLTDSPQRDSARLQTLAFDEKIDLPLTLVSEAAAQGSTLSIPRESSVAVVTYKDRKVIQKFTHKSGACDKSARAEIVAASEKLARDDASEK